MIIYRSDRIGNNSRLFSMYKLRTMVEEMLEIRYKVNDYDLGLTQ